MNVKTTLAKSAAIVALGSVASMPAQAQTLSAAGPPAMSFSYSGQRDTWNTVLLVSGIVGVVGLVSGDSTLVLLGGAGVLLSLYETSSSRFHFQGYHRGADLLTAGPLSFGVNSEPGIALAPGLARSQPCPYIQWKIKL